jgi:hypothetical protein
LQINPFSALAFSPGSRLKRYISSGIAVCRQLLQVQPLLDEVERIVALDVLGF